MPACALSCALHEVAQSSVSRPRARRAGAAQGAPRASAAIVRRPHIATAAYARAAASGPLEELSLTEENVLQALLDVREELSALFDEAIGMTGTVTLVEVDGPFVTVRMKGRFWHPRGMVLARVGAYLQARIPEIMEVLIESDTQLDDSPAAF